jgi:hypothetical protein
MLSQKYRPVNCATFGGASMTGKPNGDQKTTIITFVVEMMRFALIGALSPCGSYIGSSFVK